MALTANQDIPKKVEATEPWTFRRLFPFASTVTALTKVFINPFDVLLGYLVLVAGIAELLGRRISLVFWAFTILVLIAALLERHLPAKPETQEKKKKEFKKP